MMFHMFPTSQNLYPNVHPHCYIPRKNTSCPRNSLTLYVPITDLLPRSYKISSWVQAQLPYLSVEHTLQSQSLIKGNTRTGKTTRHKAKDDTRTGKTTRHKTKDDPPTRSKSVDFTELLQSPHSHPRPSLSRMGLKPLTEKTGWNCENLVEHDGHQVNGERFGVVLGIISSSIPSPSASAKRFRLEGKLKLGSLSSSSEGKCSAVKRVFSMRRSASVSERYCRIHDQSNDEDCTDEGLGSPQKPVKQQHKGSKILKACKRFFSLK